MIGTAASVILIYACCALGFLWAIINYCVVKSIDVDKGENQTKTEGTEGYEPLASSDGDQTKKIQTMKELSSYIARGANAFLYQEYVISFIFIFFMGIIIKFAIDRSSFANWSTAVAFWTGSITSIISGFIGMRVAVSANFRTAFKAQYSLPEAFKCAFRAGCVMGFALSALAVAVLNTLILIYKQIYNFSPFDETNLENSCNFKEVPNWYACPQSGDDLTSHVYECIAGYGLGGSTIALFGRVGGGIYTKAADVGADLVGKVEKDLAEDSPLNPATIADNVGDNVGDIAGMGSDLFGSFAEATCAALVVLASAGNQRFFAAQFMCTDNWDGKFEHVEYCSSADAYLYYPIMISALAIVACFICSIFATNLMSVEKENEIERSLRYQLIIASVLLSGALYLAGFFSLDAPDNAQQIPIEISKGKFLQGMNGTLILPYQGQTYSLTDYYELTPLNSYICTMSGMIVGLFIGLLTEYYTSNAYEPVREVAHSCETGAATNIIYGLALGYLSTILPIILIGVAAYISHKTLGLFGTALAALGILSNLAVSLAVDAYGPISDNAGGIAEMSELHPGTRRRTDALDAAGNTTAAIGKGFAIGSAAFVSMALYGAFITRSKAAPYGIAPSDAFVIHDVEVTDALLFSGLLIGAMLPFAFSAMTMKSVGKAALQMVKEIRDQLEKEPGILKGEVPPNYERCVEISTKASLREMIGPGALVIVTPLAVGLIFGPRAVAGLLPGALVSGVQMAISASNTGGAWDNAKKFIESGQLIVNDEVKKKGTDEHKAAVIGDTVGDPLKDTSGPSLNILVKLSAILSLVFAPFFQVTGFLVCPLNENPNPGKFRQC